MRLRRDGLSPHGWDTFNIGQRFYAAGEYEDAFHVLAVIWCHRPLWDTQLPGWGRTPEQQAEWDRVEAEAVAFLEGRLPFSKPSTGTPRQWFQADLFWARSEWCWAVQRCWRLEVDPVSVAEFSAAKNCYDTNDFNGAVVILRTIHPDSYDAGEWERAIEAMRGELGPDPGSVGHWPIPAEPPPPQLRVHPGFGLRTPGPRRISAIRACQPSVHRETTRSAIGKTPDAGDGAEGGLDDANLAHGDLATQD